MKLWVTGKDGMLGRAFVRLCSDRGIPFVATSRLDVDVTDMAQMQRFVEGHTPTHLINCSGFTAVDLAEREKEKAYLLNATAPENMGKLGIKVIHFSTDYVFDGAQNTPYLETDVAHPLSAYGASKLEGEKRLLDANPEACVMRISWLFGRKPTHFVAKMVRLLQEKEVIGVATDQVGCPTYAEDVAEWALALLDQSGIWHAVNTGSVSRYDWVVSIWNQLKKMEVPMKCLEVGRALTSDFPLPAKRPCYSALSTEKLEAFGVKPRQWNIALESYLMQEFLCHAM